MMKLVLVALSALALIGGLQVQRGGSGAARVPEVEYRLRVLPNGLKVYSVVDRTTPDVAVQVWYGVGGKDDPPGRSGFAHLFEHLMFRGARDMPADYISRLTEDAGGDNNASTDSDFTEYEDLSPAGRLPQLLWAEAARMSSLVLDEAGFRAERAVVEQELRQEVLSDPYGPLFEFEIPQMGFTSSGYRHSPIGSIADLEAATLDEAKAFHARYYRPDNAALVVVGDFDETRLQAWVDRYFGPISHSNEALPQAPVTLPGPAERVINAFAPDAPDPAVVLSYAAPDAGARDAAALRVLNAILTKGGTSRLYMALVHQRRLASDVFSDVDLRQRAGMIDVGAVMAPGGRLRDGEAALTAAIADLRERPVSQAELAAAKNQLRAQALEGRETIDGLASQIGYAVVVEGDVAHVNTDPMALEAVTAADVRRVANLYLADSRRVILHYRPDDRLRPATGDVRLGARLASAAAPRPARHDVDPPRAPSPATLPPLGPAPVPAARPAPEERVLSNGLRVVVARTGDLPLATALIRFRGGSALDPAGKAGLTAMTASLAAQGAGGRTAAAVSAAITGLGDSYSARVDEDSSTVKLSGLSNLAEALPILADVVRRPRFDDPSVKQMRRQMQDEAAESLEDVDELADMAVAHLVFGSGPYGHPTGGSPASLTHIRRDDVVRQYERIYRPDNAVLVVTGNVDPEAVFALAERAFGDWAKPKAPMPAEAPEEAAPPGRTVLIDAPGEAEATVIVAGRAVRRLDKSFYAVEVANSILGGGYSSRLNEEIRIRRGLTYDATSQVDERAHSGLFSATVEGDASAAPEIASLMLEQLKSIASEAATPDELKARKAALIGQALTASRTSGDEADWLADAVLYGRGLGDLNDYVSGVEAITAADVRTAATALCDPRSTNILVIGDKSRVEGELRRLFGNIEIIPIAQIAHSLS